MERAGLISFFLLLLWVGMSRWCGDGLLLFFFLFFFFFWEKNGWGKRKRERRVNSQTPSQFSFSISFTPQLESSPLTPRIFLLPTLLHRTRPPKPCSWRGLKKLAFLKYCKNTRYRSFKICEISPIPRFFLLGVFWMPRWEVRSYLFVC